jgi:hypothetical protein
VVAVVGGERLGDVAGRTRFHGDEGHWLGVDASTRERAAPTIL